MGPLVVKGSDELIEARLLLQEVPGGGLAGFLPERQMHALVTTVLLGMPWFDAFIVDPEP